MSRIVIEKSESCEYELSETELAEIKIKYNGDVESWVLENMHIFDFKNEENTIRYNQAQLGKLIDEVDETAYIQSIISPDKYLCDLASIPEEYQEAIFAIEDLKYASEFADIGNPKAELNGIYFKDKTMYATDTRKFIALETETNISYPVFIPTEFVEGLLHGGKLFSSYDGMDFKSILFFNDKYYQQDIYSFRYPDAKSILSNDEHRNKSSHHTIDSYFSQVQDRTVTKPYSPREPEVLKDFNGALLIEDHYKLIKRDLVNHMLMTEEDRPMHFIGERCEMVFMPFVE